MFQGVLNARSEAIVCLRLRGPSGIESKVEFIVDSGFSSSLTLSATMVATLGLTRVSGSKAVLADGSVRQFDLCAAEVDWGGTWRTVLVSANGNEPLLGMRLLADHKLAVEEVPGGLVEILPLP